MQAAIAKQKEAAQKQMAAVRSAVSTPWVGTTVSPSSALSDVPNIECEPLPDIQLTPMITAAATAQKVQPELIRAVMRQESAFRPCAVSNKGAMGLMQLMPATAEQFQVTDPFDPVQNVQSGAKYLKQLIDRFGGDLKLALAAYNAGPERIEGNTIPDIPETRNYVQQILKEVEKTNP